MICRRPVTILGLVDKERDIIVDPVDVWQNATLDLMTDILLPDDTLFITDHHSYKIFHELFPEKEVVAINLVGSAISGHNIFKEWEKLYDYLFYGMDRGRQIAIYGGKDLVEAFLPNATRVYFNQVGIGEGIKGNRFIDLPREDWARGLGCDEGIISPSDAMFKLYKVQEYIRKNNGSFLPL